MDTNVYSREREKVSDRERERERERERKTRGRGVEDNVFYFWPMRTDLYENLYNLHGRALSGDHKSIILCIFIV